LINRKEDYVRPISLAKVELNTNFVMEIKVNELFHLEFIIRVLFQDDYGEYVEPFLDKLLAESNTYPIVIMRWYHE